VQNLRESKKRDSGGFLSLVMPGGEGKEGGKKSKARCLLDCKKKKRQGAFARKGASPLAHLPTRKREGGKRQLAPSPYERSRSQDASLLTP